MPIELIFPSEFDLILGEPAAFWWFIIQPSLLLLAIYCWDSGIDILVP